jgi:membrane associated rhomboid family serine protease
MFPIKDENPTKGKPILTIILIVVNIAVFIATYLSGQFDQVVDSYGLKPAEMFAGQRLHTLFTSMFLHGGFLHIFGNMLYLWIFGDNIEDVLGRGKFILFYLGCGIIASLAQGLWEPSSTIPMIGASGAISGILGAYIVLYPRTRVYTLVWYYVVKIPAVAFLGFWFVLQVLNVSILTVAGAPSGVAYLAHIGGFVAGAMMILPVRRAVKKRRARYTYRVTVG